MPNSNMRSLKCGIKTYTLEVFGTTGAQPVRARLPAEDGCADRAVKEIAQVREKATPPNTPRLA